MKQATLDVMTAFIKLLEEVGAVADQGNGIEVGKLNALIVERLQVPMSYYFNAVVNANITQRELERHARKH
jgi:hypothetical protein